VGSKDGLLKTPLHEAHEAAGARLVDFAGWRMPMLYTSILDEQAATRRDATIFDVSHMGRIRIRGDYAFKLVDRLCTADMLAQEDNTTRYALLLNDAGGVIDDVIVLRMPEQWLVVCNASNRLKVLAHLEKVNETESFGATVVDRTMQTAMLAVQGPRALAKLAAVLPIDVAAIGRHEVVTGTVMLVSFTASRTGYTGEDGLEVILPAAAAMKAWEFITSDAGGVTPAGLGARDLLRLEAALPLYGHELNETIDPITAGLGRAVRRREGFIGYDAIAKIRDSGPARKLVGLKLDTPRIARQGAVVAGEGVEVGVVTSGTFSPSCAASIALAYVDRGYAEIGNRLRVTLRADNEADAEIVPKPFYRGSAFQAK